MSNKLDKLAKQRASQLAKLQRLLRALDNQNRFYTSRIQRAGLDINTDFTLADFCQGFPFTLKDELVEDQQEHPPYGTNLTFPIHAYHRFSQTSGTSGRPLRWLDTGDSWEWMVDNWVRIYQASTVTEEDRVFFAFSFGPFLGFWTAFDAAEKIGALCIPGGGLGSVGRLQVIIDNKCTVLCCTPTYAIRLGEVAREENIDLGASEVRAIIVAGEAGGSIPETYGYIERLWPGARVYDHHGMTEIGPVSYECPKQRGRLHILEDAFFPEIIDVQTGTATAPGELGELVLTNLGRTGSPLIRYRTGDVVKAPVEDICVCGTAEMALEGGILTRSDDMISVRGVNVYPRAVEAVVRRSGEVFEYQVEIRTVQGMESMTLLIEVAAGTNEAAAAAIASQLETDLRAALSLRIAVQVVPPETLPRFEMKAKRWIKK